MELEFLFIKGSLINKLKYGYGFTDVILIGCIHLGDELRRTKIWITDLIIYGQ